MASLGFLGVSQGSWGEAADSAADEIAHAAGCGEGCRPRLATQRVVLHTYTCLSRLLHMLMLRESGLLWLCYVKLTLDLRLCYVIIVCVCYVFGCLTSGSRCLGAVTQVQREPQPPRPTRSCQGGGRGLPRNAWSV